MSVDSGFGYTGTKKLDHQPKLPPYSKMKATKGKSQGRLCACGNPDQDKLATCSKCGAREHIYCMLIPQGTIPRVWQCGDCIAFRATPSAGPGKVIPTCRKQSSQNGKVKRIGDEEASSLYGRVRCGSSAQYFGLRTPPKKKHFADKRNEFFKRMHKVVSPERPAKVRRTYSPPLWLSKPLRTTTVNNVSNVHLWSDQALENRKEIVCALCVLARKPMKHVTEDAPMESDVLPVESEASAPKSRGHVHGVSHEWQQLENLVIPKCSPSETPMESYVYPVETEASAPKSGRDVHGVVSHECQQFGTLVIPKCSPSGTPMESDLLPVEPEASAPKSGRDVHGVVSHECQQFGNLVIPKCSPLETPMESDLLPVEPEASAPKSGRDVHWVVSHECQQLGNLVIPKCSPSNPLPRTKNFPPLPSELASWTGKFIFSDPAIPDDFNVMFEAYPPMKVRRAAYEYSAFLPDELVVDLIPLSELPPHLLPHDSLDYYWDSALYIIPDCTDHSRSVRDYHRLLKVMLNQEVAIISSLDGGVELLIFTSKQMHLDDAKCSSERVYLCAVFYDALTYNNNMVECRLAPHSFFGG